MIKCICGLPGSGKNQYATSLAIQNLKKGIKVYSSYPIKTKLKSYNKDNFLKDVEIRTFKINKEMFLKGQFDTGSVIIFDEAYLDFFNQEWKSANKEEIKKYSGSRHLGLTLYYITQNPQRILPYLRDVTDSYIWIEKRIFWNRCTEYFELENVGKLVGEDLSQLSPRLVRQWIYLRNKKIMISYNDSYLKDTVTLDNKHEEMYPTFEVEYRNIIKRIKASYKRLIDFRKSLT